MTALIAPAPRVGVPAHEPLAHLVRGQMVESVHYGSVVVLAPDGTTLFAAGDPDVACYPRSAAKPLQAAALARLGLRPGPAGFAIGAASHSGEQMHLDAVTAVLDGISSDHLRNPAGLPYDPVERDRWVATGRAPSRLAHTCSGKHAAMLATCRLLGWPLAGYLAPDHPLQCAIAETVEDLTGQGIARVAVDGCGAPLFAISLRGLAAAVSAVAAAAPDTPEGLVADGMRRHPELVAGSRRDVTAVMRAVPGLITKDGVEGVQVAALPDGTAVALKVADGGDRARHAVLAAALKRCGVDVPQDPDALQVTGVLAGEPEPEAHLADTDGVGADGAAVKALR